MKEEKIIQYLKDANFWGEKNLYFYTLAPQNFSKEENIYGFDKLNIKYYIVNKNENGIGIIPFDITGKSIKELVMFVPNEDIKEVYTEKYKFMLVLSGNRLIIKTNQNKVLELEYMGKETGNMYKFLSEYKEN